MDRIIRGTAHKHQVRIIGAVTTETVDTAVNNHKTTPVVSAALGRLLTGALIMGMTMKNDNDKLTIQIKSDGPIGGMLVTADSKGHVKGYATNTQVDLPLSDSGKLDVGRAVGKGYLQVIKDIGLKEAYTGQTELVTGEIADDLTYYYFSSEQTPSIIALGVLVDKDYSIKQAGGIMIQLMPGAEEEVIETLEKNVESISSLTTLLEEGETLEAIIERFTKGLLFEKMDEVIPSFLCDCNKERVEKVLISLGADEIRKMIDENEPIEMTCHFCNKQYIFSVQDLELLSKDF